MTKKVLILFGAGASNGSGGILDPPPLGRDLFTRLSNQFPNSWGKLSEKYRSKFSENFEKGMEMFYNEVDDYTQYLKDMTIFFSKFKIDYFKENLYWILISKYIHPLESTELMLSTINYDCLIELAALQFNPNITYWGKNKGIKILKIHGSCNFIKSNVRGEGKIIIGKGTIKGGLRLIHPREVEKELRNNPLPASMSLYARGKKVFISPDQINQILGEFHDYLSTVEVVFVIGVNPNIEDTHIWDYLKNLGDKLYLIGSEENCKQWIKNYNSSATWLCDKFDKGYSKLCNILDKILDLNNKGNSTVNFTFRSEV